MLIVLAAMPVSASAKIPFDDVKEDDWFYDAVLFSYENDLMKGISQTKFSPSEPLTRAMFAQILYNLTENKESDYGDISKFYDINDKQWYYDSVQWAGMNYLVEGTDYGKFSPNQHLTREQAVKMLFSYFVRSGNDTTISNNALSNFTDANRISSWAKISFEWAVSNKIVAGTTNTTLSPKNSMNRAEAAQILKNVLPLIHNRSLISRNKETANPVFSAISYIDFSFSKLNSALTLEESKKTDNEVYYVSKAHPEYYFVFLVNIETGKVDDNTVCDRIETSISKSYSELIGISVGGASKKLEKYSNYIIEYENKTNHLLYFAGNYMVELFPTANLLFEEDSKVVFTRRWQTLPIDGPTDNKFSYYVDDKPLFSFELSSIWTDNYWNLDFTEPMTSYPPIYFCERLSMTRVETNGYLFSIEVYEGNVNNLRPVETKLYMLKLDGIVYTVTMNKPTDVRFIEDDKEAKTMYLKLQNDIPNILKSIRFPENVEVIE